MWSLQVSRVSRPTRWSQGQYRWRAVPLTSPKYETRNLESVAHSVPCVRALFAFRLLRRTSR
jgi:hypothetical protein